jgi:O-antigen/teichoic acid export membrane protein
LLAFPLAIGAGLAAPAIIRLLYGPAYSQAAGVLQIASIGVPFAFLSTFFDGVLGAIDRQGQCTLIRGTMLILLVGSSWLLVQRLGYQGAAWAFVLAEAAACLILYLALARDIQWRSLGPALWKAGLAGAVMAAGMWAGREAFVLWQLGLGAGLYVLALWGLRAFSPAEVSVARALLQRVGDTIKKKESG